MRRVAQDEPTAVPLLVAASKMAAARLVAVDGMAEAAKREAVAVAPPPAAAIALMATTAEVAKEIPEDMVALVATVEPGGWQQLGRCPHQHGWEVPYPVLQCTDQ